MLLSLLPFHAFMWFKTGNPIFLFYNEIFHSPYWKLENFKDIRWGPLDTYEKILWPLISSFMPNRISELAHYSGRLLLAISAIPLIYFTKKKYKDVLPLAVIFLFSSFLWSSSTGYIRYGIFLDILGGLLILLTLETLYTLYSRRTLNIVMVIILTTGLQIQLLSALQYSLSYNWSNSYNWTNPTFLSNQTEFLEESSNILQDYKLTTFQTDGNRNMIKGVEVWLDTSPKTSGLEIELKSNIPFVYLRGYNPPYKEIEAFFTKNSHKNIYTLCASNELKDVEKLLKPYNLRVESVKILTIPYYSRITNVEIFLIKVST